MLPSTSACGLLQTPELVVITFLVLVCLSSSILMTDMTFCVLKFCNVSISMIELSFDNGHMSTKKHMSLSNVEERQSAKHGLHFPRVYVFICPQTLIGIHLFFACMLKYLGNNIINYLITNYSKFTRKSEATKFIARCVSNFSHQWNKTPSIRNLK